MEISLYDERKLKTMYDDTNSLKNDARNQNTNGIKDKLIKNPGVTVISSPFKETEITNEPAFTNNIEIQNIIEPTMTNEEIVPDQVEDITDFANNFNNENEGNISEEQESEEDKALNQTIEFPNEEYADNNIVDEPIIKEKPSDIDIKEEVAEEPAIENIVEPVIELPKEESIDNSVIDESKEIEEANEPTEVAEEADKEIEIDDSEVQNKETDLNDLIQFETYDEYLKAYCILNRKPEDHIKFFTDLRRGIKPQDLLTEEEFIDEKRKQIDAIKYNEQEQEKLALKKELSEKEAQLKSSGEKVDDLQNDLDNTNIRLQETREDNVSLSKKIADLEAQKSDQENNINKLENQLRDISSKLKESQDIIYNKDRELTAKENSGRKLAEENERLKAEIEAAEKNIKSLNDELSKSKAKIDELIANVKNQIDSIKSNDKNDKKVVEEEQEDEKKNPELDLSENKSDINTEISSSAEEGEDFNKTLTSESLKKILEEAIEKETTSPKTL